MTEVEVGLKRQADKVSVAMSSSPTTCGSVKKRRGSPASAAATATTPPNKGEGMWLSAKFPSSSFYSLLSKIIFTIVHLF